MRHHTTTEVKSTLRGSNDIIVVGRYIGNILGTLRAIHFESTRASSRDSLNELDHILARYDGVNDEGYHLAMKDSAPYMEELNKDDLIKLLDERLLTSPGKSVANYLRPEVSSNY